MFTYFPTPTPEVLSHKKIACQCQVTLLPTQTNILSCYYWKVSKYYLKISSFSVTSFSICFYGNVVNVSPRKAHVFPGCPPPTPKKKIQSRSVSLRWHIFNRNSTPVIIFIFMLKMGDYQPIKKLGLIVCSFPFPSICQLFQEQMKQDLKLTMIFVSSQVIWYVLQVFLHWFLSH